MRLVGWYWKSSGGGPIMEGMAYDSYGWLYSGGDDRPKRDYEIVGPWVEPVTVTWLGEWEDAE